VGALDVVAGWPVDHVAAGTVDEHGLRTVAGEHDRPFDLASVTKVLTATAVLVAVEEETVALDDPAGPPGSTVRHLLAHASGLPFEGSTPVAAPEKRRIYSNAGFELLGEIVAERSGIDFASYLDEAVAQPLGLSATALTGSPARDATSTVDDMLGVAAELLTPSKVLSPITLAEATAPVFPDLAGVLPGFGRQDPNPWGLGFELRDGKVPHWTPRQASPATFGHFGRSGTFLWVDPQEGIACVALTDRPFGQWAIEAWPALGDRVLDEVRSGG
jgi:CubicO group peptidase (beta-lactamase class C family)